MRTDTTCASATLASSTAPGFPRPLSTSTLGTLTVATESHDQTRTTLEQRQPTGIEPIRIQQQPQQHSQQNSRSVRVAYREAGPLQDTSASALSQPKDVRIIKVRKSPSRRHRVHPAAVSARGQQRAQSRRQMDGRSNGVEQPKSRRNSKTRGLRVETCPAPQDERAQSQTPRSDLTTTPRTPANVRGSSDLRSPGANKTPVAMAANLPANNTAIPDFITQTDANGNATTPRSAGAIQKAGGKQAGHPTYGATRLPGDEGNNGGGMSPSGNGGDGLPATGNDACDSLLESFRMMCCCLVPDSVINSHSHVIKEAPTHDSSVSGQMERPALLGPIHPDDKGKKCLVLDLDETLVHSSFRAVPGADFVIPVQIEDVVHFVYVMKRPGVDEFLVEMAKHYEIVIYTASLNKYADPLLDLLDPHKTIRARLFRESCVFYEGNYVKDLNLIGRDLTQSIIIDNSPNSYLFHPDNAIDCSSFIDDPRDRELDQIGGFLKDIKDIKDVRGRCHEWKQWPAGDR